jgi:D-xylose transport system permease protein
VILPALVSAIIIFGIVAVLSHGNGLPLPVLLLTAMLLAASYATTRTRYGTHLYAVGGNREAAQRAGIPVSRMIIYSFLVLGACGAIAGIVDASRLLGVSVSSGSGPLMLNAIAAAVVGGTSLFGGRGTVWAALIGALVIGSINNGVQLLGLSTEVQSFATGAVLILAVSIDVMITRGSIRPNRH